ncbi:MAG: LysR family transcriptional regulator [Lachnospiraceae bacterium]|nr:LysR family transcriptional regulator [Lachnospiraceae bacterium]
MDLFQLKVFISLASTLNYKRAAEENHISQPAVSYHIKNLETELEVQLLERSKYRTSLTEAGLEFLRYAQQICEQEYLARERLSDISRGKTGRITLAGVQTYLPQISQAAAAFMKAYPEVRVDTMILDGPDLLRSHMFSEYDIYFGVDTMISDNGSYQSRKGPEEYMDLYFPEELEARITMEDWSSFSDIPYISIPQKNSLLYNRTAVIMKDLGYVPGIVHHASSVESILTLVDAGCGISILPSGSCGSRYPHMRSRQILHEYALLPLLISCRKDRNQPVIRSFMESALPGIG